MMNNSLAFILQPLHLVINIYIWIIIIAAVVSFLNVDRRQPFIELLDKLTLPAFQFIRQKMPFVVISGIDLSPIVLIVLLQFIDTLMMNGVTLALLSVIHSLIFSYIIIVIVAAVLSFVDVNPYNPIVSTINRLTQPLFQSIRQKLPFVVIAGIDLSPIIVIFGLQILDGLLTQLFVGL